MGVEEAHVLFAFSEVPLEANDINAIAGEQRHVADCRAVVCIDVQLKLGIKLKCILILFAD